jgi:uncharacterized lipoprotein
MNKINIIVVSVLSLLLVACSNLKKYDHREEYKNVAPEQREIRLPQDLSSKNMETYYKIPAIKNKSYPNRVSIIPPGSSLEK